ncbi:type VI secretion system-associated FHA domain protein TagH [Roseibium aggregatum]|uniref:Type VI secretion system-associated FHA domain protein TagH n=1 Tax=Roseibium aggregatum TaxID=187304 RepID=A0A939J1I3_9HYPH|nr:type VI secretion system-associated FHA domain protein TagH [Roseibium aggregatum]MBN9670378.1 type VI secretion system-associated FHA domain protein TagH [Roseibium aggregatum]
MRITLQIENVDRLETGGQVSYSCADRGFDIGRHEHLDWSLPDPQRVISGKHCEVRFEGGQFILYDTSTNGTFVNGSPNRMDKPHPLRAGDRVMIGDYIISVALDAADSSSASFGQPSAAMAPATSQGQPWDVPQPASSQPAGPAWPETPSSPRQESYPMPEQGGPWATPSPGMEGRHAPPSSAPGIGTPADDVWSRQGHGWGSADPSLYDPNAQVSEREAARPAQADPLDHLAAQPDLQQPAPFPNSPDPVQPDVSQVSPFPPFGETPDGPTDGQPLFGMPDFGAQDAAEAPTGPASEPEPEANEQLATPFPEAPAWTAPETDEPEAAPDPQPAEPPVEAPPPPPPPPQAAPAEPTSALPSGEPADQPVETGNVPLAQNSGSTQVVAGNADFVKAFAEGAGIPASVLEGRDPEELARELGTILQDITGDLMGLLQARSQVKAMTRNANRTLIGRSGNNALKFSPTPQMALQTMLSQNAVENGYLPIDKALKAAFKDIQKHHVWTYAAMQKAAARFDQTLSPAAIEGEGKVQKGTFSNPKGKLWERIQDRWTSLSGAYDDGIVGVFTQYFTECYEELSSEDPELPSQ